MVDARGSAARKERRVRRQLEMYAAILLGLASIAASWSSYQAARWGGAQATDYNRASALRVESTRASAAADELKAIDIAMFSAWVGAYASGTSALQTFYAERMRPEFRPAFDAWVEAERAGTPVASTPFALELYRLSSAAEADTLAEQAEATFAIGAQANERSDAYVLNVVFLATVLFLAGIAQQFDWVRLKLALLVLGTVVLAVGLFNIVTMPKL